MADMKDFNDINDIYKQCKWIFCFCFTSMACGTNYIHSKQSVL